MKSKAGTVGFLLAAGAALIALGVSASAGAYEAYVASPAPLFAGPSPDYPPIVDFNGGEPVTVYGCLDGYDWCDVSFEGYRGWFEGSLLDYPYEGQRVPLFDYGYQAGVPVIGFSFDDYWGRYYRDRPFYRDRDRFVRIPPPQPRPHFAGPPGFNRGPGPGGYPPPGPRPDYGRQDYGRQDYGRPENGPRPEFNHGPGPQPNQQMQRGPEPQRPQPPQPQGQPQPQPQRPQQQGQPQNRQAPPQGQQPPRPQPQQAQPPRPQPQQRPPQPSSQPAPHPEGQRPEEGPH